MELQRERSNLSHPSPVWRYNSSSPAILPPPFPSSPYGRINSARFLFDTVKRLVYTIYQTLRAGSATVLLARCIIGGVPALCVSATDAYADVERSGGRTSERARDG